MVNVLKNSVKPFLKKIAKSASLKSKNGLNFIMVVMLRKSRLVLEIKKKTQASKTSTAS